MRNAILFLEEVVIITVGRLLLIIEMCLLMPIVVICAGWNGFMVGCRVFLETWREIAEIGISQDDQRL